MMTHRKFIFLILVILPLSLSFRTFFSVNKWDQVSNSTTSSRKLFVDFGNGSRAIPNDIELADPLADAGDSVTLSQAMQSIFDDYNNIQAAYVELVDTSDSDYADSDKRLITIEFTGSPGATSGQASLEMDGDKVVGCKIEGAEDLLDSSKEFVRTIAHEIGHCLGLDHPQETVNAIMSYYRRDGDLRVLMDDKMGVIYLFPKNNERAKEENSFGLSCSKR